MSDILENWNNLDSDHKKFVLRVMRGNGCKHSAEPCSIDSDIRLDPPHQEYFESIALWKKSEESGFIECTGSYKWIVTNKFRELERIIFDI